MAAASPKKDSTKGKLFVRPLTKDLVPAVQALNARIAAKGGRWRFYDTVVPRWLAPAPGATSWREIYVLVDQDSGMVRGGCVLKPEQFQLNGEMIELGWLQGPVAESAVDKSLKGLGSILVKFSLERHPLQISWGANSIAAPSAGSAPMLIQVINTARFLKIPAVFNKNKALRMAIRCATMFGLPQLGVTVAQIVSRMFGTQGPPATVSVEPEFGPWADEIWLKAKDAYGLIALRDSATLNRAMPSTGYPESFPLKVVLGEQVVGWAAVRDRELTEDPYFNGLRAGSIIDALALPGHEATVIGAATQFLRDRGVDFIGAGFLHADWISAFQGAGFLAIPNKRNIGFTPGLAERAGGVAHLLSTTHLAMIDSDGPRLF